MRTDEYRKYELWLCVSIIQCEGCMHVNGYRKYGLLECVRIVQRTGCMCVNEHAGASCWHM